MTVSASMSPSLIPSSIASLARNGGASAVSVAAMSEPIASAVRARYGAVSRASVETRRTVWAQDQSFDLGAALHGQVRPGLPDLHGRTPAGPRARRPVLHARAERWETHLPDPMASSLSPKCARVGRRSVPRSCRVVEPSAEKPPSCAPPPRRAPRTPARAARARRSRGRPGSSSSSSSCVPRATMRPRSRTTSSSASAIVESRWATISVVRPFIASRSPRRMRASVRRVDGRGGVVEDEDPRVEDERPRDRDPLALSARERDPALADHRVVAVGQLAR